MEYKDYYKVLGVAKDAPQDEIKRVYRKLARKYHPDVSKEAEAEERFKEVGEAYEVLKDPEKRAAYDQLGADWKAGQEGFKPPPDWNQDFEFQGGGYTGADAEQFSDFFESLFGRGGHARGARGAYQQPHQEFNLRGEDVRAKIVIDLEDAFQGASRTLNLQQVERDAHGRPQVKERALNVRIPKGIRQGQTIRLARQGNPGIGKGEAGDLYLEIEFRPHPLYQTEGKDVYLNLPVTPWEAALGTTLKIPTPAGTVDMKIPPNSSGGRKLRLKGRGIPAREPGDFYVMLQVALPPADTDAAKAAYKALEQAANFNPRQAMGV